MSDESPATPAGQLVCPGCDLAFEAEAGAVARVEQCPGCGQPILIPAMDGSTEIPEETEAADTLAEDDGINRLHVQQLTRERRSLIRSRSHALVGLGLCLVGAGELMLFGVRAIRHHEPWTGPALYFLLVPVALWLAWRMARLALNLHRQSKVELLDEPDNPPDFSTLQDGSQFVENLKKLHERDGNV